MTRTAARELAVRLCFAAQLSGENAEETVASFFTPEYFQSLAEEDAVFSEYPDEQQMAYIRKIVDLVSEHTSELNQEIESYAKGWRVDRISKIAAVVLRCAMCEILYLEDVPAGVAANEAVELTKRYADPETASFVNGILGSFIRDRSASCDQPVEEAPSAEA